MAGPVPQASCQGTGGSWMGPWGALSDGWAFSRAARGLCSRCRSRWVPSLVLLALPSRGRVGGADAHGRLSALGRGCLIPKGAHERAAMKSGSQRPGRRARKAWPRHSPSPKRATVLPDSGVGWEGRGWHVPPLGMACAQAWQLLSSPWQPGSPGLCRYQLALGWPLSLTTEEHFLDRPPPCILGTHHEKGAQTFWSVVNRLPLSGNAVLCWKFCHVFHKLLRDGHSNVSATSLARQPPWGRTLSPVGLHGAVGDAGGLVPPWGSLQGGDRCGDPSLLALAEPSQCCSAHNPPVLHSRC